MLAPAILVGFHRLDEITRILPGQRRHTGTGCIAVGAVTAGAGFRRVAAGRGVTLTLGFGALRHLHGIENTHISDNRLIQRSNQLLHQFVISAPVGIGLHGGREIFRILCAQVGHA